MSLTCGKAQEAPNSTSTHCRSHAVHIVHKAKRGATLLSGQQRREGRHSRQRGRGGRSTRDGHRGNREQPVDRQHGAVRRRTAGSLQREQEEEAEEEEEEDARCEHVVKAASWRRITPSHLSSHSHS